MLSNSPCRSPSIAETPTFVSITFLDGFLDRRGTCLDYMFKRCVKILHINVHIGR